MSKVCDILQEAIEDEKEAIPFYEKLKVNIIGHPDIKKKISKIQDDEKRHHEEIKIISEKLGCNCIK